LRHYDNKELEGATHEEEKFNLNGNDGMIPLNLVIT
jgi:hypothetical protein